MDFNKDMTPEEIINAMAQESGRLEFRLAVRQAHLQWALHRELLNSQNEFQKSQLKKTKSLVIATWIMATATWIIALGSIFIIN